MEDRIVEAVARAIYDAPLEISGGDTIAEIVHSCEWINDTQPLDAQLEQVREVCGELARAAITAYQAEAWQPIETFDGSEAYALAWDGYDVSEARYHPNEDGWWLANTHPTDAHDGEVYPTYWMPKPTAPKASP